MNRMIIEVSPLYSQALSNISTLMAAKKDTISSECSRQVTELNSGLSTTNEQIQVIHIVLHEALSMVKKSLLLNIQLTASPLFTQELL